MQEFALHAAVTEVFSILEIERENPEEITDFLLGNSKVKLDFLKEKLHSLTETQTSRIFLFQDKHRNNKKVEPLLNLINSFDCLSDTTGIDGTTLATPSRSSSMITVVLRSKA